MTRPASPARRATALLALGLIGLQSACMQVEPGQSGVSAELNRLQGRNGFAVVSNAPTRTVFAAKGREVVIAPAAGFCVASDSLNVSGTAAFALLADCGSGSNLARAPRPFPGVLTVSVSGGPMVDPGSSSSEALAGLESFLGSQAGAGLLGRGRGSRVAVVEMRRVGDGLYVLVEDGSGDPLPVLAPRFWRAFVELGGRMSMITASTFREAPVEEEKLLAFLVRQVVALRHANNAAPSGEELQLAGRLDDAYTVAAAEPSGRSRDVTIEVVGSGDGPPDYVDTPAAGQAVAGVTEVYQPVAAPSGEVYRGPDAGAAADASAAGPSAEETDPAVLPVTADAPAPGPANEAGSSGASNISDPPYAGRTVTVDSPYAGPGASGS